MRAKERAEDEVASFSPAMDMMLAGDVVRSPIFLFTYVCTVLLLWLIRPRRAYEIGLMTGVPFAQDHHQMVVPGFTELIRPIALRYVQYNKTRDEVCVIPSNDNANEESDKARWTALQWVRRQRNGPTSLRLHHLRTLP